jgi:hypothetical protein
VRVFLVDRVVRSGSYNEIAGEKIKMGVRESKRREKASVGFWE